MTRWWSQPRIMGRSIKNRSGEENLAFVVDCPACGFCFGSYSIAMNLSQDRLINSNSKDAIAYPIYTSKAKQNLEPEDRELIMELSPLYLERLDASVQSGVQQGMQQGIQRGIQQGERLVVENLLRIRFGNLDEELLSIIEPLL